MFSMLNNWPLRAPHRPATPPTLSNATRARRAPWTAPARRLAVAKSGKVRLRKSRLWCFDSFAKCGGQNAMVGFVSCENYRIYRTKKCEVGIAKVSAVLIHKTYILCVDCLPQSFRSPLSFVVALICAGTSQEITTCNIPTEIIGQNAFIWWRAAQAPLLK